MRADAAEMLRFSYRVVHVWPSARPAAGGRRCAVPARSRGGCRRPRGQSFARRGRPATRDRLRWVWRTGCSPVDRAAASLCGRDCRIAKPRFRQASACSSQSAHLVAILSRVRRRPCWQTKGPRGEARPRWRLSGQTELRREPSHCQATSSENAMFSEAACADSPLRSGGGLLFGKCLLQRQLSPTIKSAGTISTPAILEKVAGLGGGRATARAMSLSSFSSRKMRQRPRRLGPAADPGPEGR